MDELFPLDVQNYSGIEKAVEGSEVVYVTIGFEYKTKVWSSVWPPFMQAVLKACKNHGARLVFFDNVYAYSKSSIPFMTEESVIDPPSRKGAVRRELHEMIMNAVEKGELQAIIARSADFYGPNSPQTIFQRVIDNFRHGKKAQLFGKMDTIHTFTYTPDAGKATALLGNTPDAFNQVWHLPTTKEKITIKQWVELFAREMSVSPDIQLAPTWMLRLLGLFIPVMREFPEMMYQYEQDYFFDSSKFEKRFGWGATSPEIGVKEMVKWSMKGSSV